MMPSADRINTLWSLVRASSAEGRRTRRRLGAGASLTILMSGLLTATGLGIVVVAFAGVVLVTIGGAAVARARSACWPSVRLLGGRIAAAILRRSGMVLANARTGLRRVRRLVSSVLAWLRLRGSGFAQLCADRAFRARRYLATSGEATVRRMREGVERAQRQRLSHGAQPIELHREALRLNASGTRRRRNGAHAEAVDLHRRELGEEEHEGQIIANLGLAHRRYGRYEQSENVLQLALTKLTPASRAYETIEAEVSRAS